MGEVQYLNLIRSILKDGVKTQSRNGYVYSSFGHMMKFNLSNNKIPLITTKKLAFKTCAKELFWFIRGETDNTILQNQNVKIWNGNASKEFLESRGLGHYEEGDLGPIYGYQWRRFNEEYKGKNHTHNPSHKEQDQLQFVIDSLMDKTDEGINSRRLVVSAWNPLQLNKMALPPCHVLFQFKADHKTKKLDCSLYQRSGDVGLGVPFNIASYSLLTHIIAHHTGLKANSFTHFLGDAHIYDDHVQSLSEQVKRKPYKFPTVEIVNRYDDINEYSLDDVNIHNYMYHEQVKMNMRV
jgi:thymidylate synthase